eukprot:jgi/Mesvir1/26423/Mv16113-RA.1
MRWLEHALQILVAKPQEIHTVQETARVGAQQTGFLGLSLVAVETWFLQRRFSSVSVSDLLAELEMLRCRRDPRFLQVLERVWAWWGIDRALFRNRDLGSLACTLSEAGGEVSRGLEWIEPEVIKRVATLYPQEISDIVLAFAIARSTWG